MLGSLYDLAGSVKAKFSRELSLPDEQSLESIISESLMPLNYSEKWYSDEEIKYLRFVEGLAREKYKNKKRKTGGPYFRHVNGVARLVYRIGEELDTRPGLLLLTTAYLHDAVEEDERLDTLRKDLSDIGRRLEQSHRNGIFDEDRELWEVIRKKRSEIDKYREGLYRDFSARILEYISSNAQGFFFKRHLRKLARDLRITIRQLTRHTDQYSFLESMDFLFTGKKAKLFGKKQFVTAIVKLADEVYNVLDIKRRNINDFIADEETIREHEDWFREGIDLSDERINYNAFKSSVSITKANRFIRDYWTRNFFAWPYDKLVKLLASIGKRALAYTEHVLNLSERTKLSEKTRNSLYRLIYKIDSNASLPGFMRNLKAYIASSNIIILNRVIKHNMDSEHITPGFLDKIERDIEFYKNSSGFVQLTLSDDDFTLELDGLHDRYARGKYKGLTGAQRVRQIVYDAHGWRAQHETYAQRPNLIIAGLDGAVLSFQYEARKHVTSL